jgi:hypothetical protein
LGDCARHLIAIVDRVEHDVDAAFLVCPGDGVDDALAERHAHIRGGAREVGELSYLRLLRVRRSGQAEDERRYRDAAQYTGHSHGRFLLIV